MQTQLKRFLSFALALIMVIGMMPTNIVHAEENEIAESAEPIATVAPTEPAETEAPTEPAETEAPTEPAATEAPAEPAATEAPTEPAATEVPAETEAPAVIENSEQVTDEALNEVAEDVVIDTEAELIAAVAEDGTVKLEGDIELTDTLTVNGEVVLDLNGHTISQTKECTGSYAMITNKGKLTITGNGKISMNDTGVNTGSDWGVYTISNYGGTLVVENGTIENVCPNSIGNVNNAIFNYSGTTTINGGTFSVPYSRSVRLWHGSVTINGGTFDGQVWVQAMSACALTINGGSFKPGSKGNDGSSVYITNDSNTVALAVTGGNFATKIGAANAAALAGSITGGTFTEAAISGTNAVLLGEDLEFDENGKVSAAKINTEERLVKAVAKGGTVKLEGDIELTDTLTVNGEVVLDLNGHTISQTKECTGSYAMITNNGKLTITGNGKISMNDTGVNTGSGWGVYTISNYGGTLIVENGIIENVCPNSIGNVNNAIFNYSGKTTINGGTFSVPYSRSVRLWHGSVTINGGTFDGQVWVQAMSACALTINGGSFKPGSKGNDGSSVYITNSTYDVALAVTDGSFATKIGAANAAALAGSITGGIFTETAAKNTNAAMLGENLAFGTDENGNYVLKNTDDGVLDTEAELVAAFAAGGEVKLVVDMKIANDLVNSGNVTLDLNGKTLSMVSEKTAASALIVNNGTLTVKDSVGGGKLAYASNAFSTSNSYSTSTAINNGILTVESGEIVNTTGGGASYAIDNYNTLTVNGGKLTSTKMAVRQAQFGNHDNSVTINGGVLSGYAGLQLHIFSTAKKTTTEINGGTFNGIYAMYTSFYKAEDSGNTDITINGGTFNGTTASMFLFNSNPGAVAFNAAVKGGNYNSGVYAYIKNEEGEIINLPVVSGGVFTENAVKETDPAVLADNLAFAADKNGNYILKSTNDGVIDTEAELIAAVTEGGTVKLEGDIELTDTLAVNGEVVLDLNGHTISQTKECTGSYSMISNKGKLTITGNGKISMNDTGVNTGSDWGVYTISNYGGTLIVENGTIENVCPNSIGNVNNAIFNYSGKTTINGGTFSVPYSRSVRLWHGSVTINGGTFDGQVWVQAMSACALTINGGSFKPGSKGNDGSSVYITNSTYDVALAVTGGNFATKIGAANAAALAGSITGGTFTEAAISGTNAALISENVEFNDKGELVERKLDSEAELISAFAKGGTVKLEGNIELTAGITVAKDAAVTLDLNGKTLSMNVEATKATALITNNGTLTIKDSVGGGKLTFASSKVSTGYSTTTIINNGILTVDGGAIENTSAKGGASYAIDNYNTLTVNGGTMSANGTSIRQAQFGNYDNTVIINGGTSTGYAGLQLHIFSTAKKTTTEINGGTFNGEYAMYTSFYKAEDSGNTDITINGGTFNGTSAALYLYNSKTGAATFNAAVKGGTFNGDVYAYIHNAEGEEISLPVIFGGTFDAPVAGEYCADGYTCVLNEDGTYGVYFYAASVGAVNYESLEEALAHAAEGEIKLLNNIKLTEGLVIANDAVVTLDLNGKTLSISVAATETSALITNNGTLTIKDSVGGGKLTYVSSSYSTNYSTSTIINNGALTVKNGTIENTTAGGAPYAIDNYNTLTVTGGKMISAKVAVRQAQFGNHENSVTINGGQFSGYAGLQLHVFNTTKKTTTVINGGTFTGDYAMYTTFYKAEDSGNTEITVNGGTFNGAVYLYTKPGGAEFDAEVKGGTFNGEFYAYIKNATGEQVNLPVISGGTFAYPVDETVCAVGFVPVLNEDGTYGVEKIQSYLELNHNYIALEVGSTYALEAIVKPNNSSNMVKWSVEGNAGIISVTQDGIVEAHAVGTDYVLATVGNGDNNLYARCRVDVTEGAVKIEEVQLSTNKLTTELFSTNYAKLDVVLLLAQNGAVQTEQVENNVMNGAMMGVVTNDAMNSQLADLSITKAVFANEELNKLFTLAITDDRTLSVVPIKETAIDNPSSVASSYSSKIILTVRGEEIETEEIKLTVKKTKPAVKATVAAFNSFYTYETRNITFTGATVTQVALNPAKTMPEWLNLAGPAPAAEGEEEIQWFNVEDTTLVLTNGAAPTKSTTGTVYLKVMTEEWTIPADVTLTVKNTYKARSLKLSASTISISEDVDNSMGYVLTLKPGNKADTLQSLEVMDIEAPEGYEIVDFTEETGEFVLKTDRHFTKQAIQLKVLFGDTDAKVPLDLTVKQIPVKLKLSANTVTLNTQVIDAATITVSATPNDYLLNNPVLTLTDRDGNTLDLDSDKLFVAYDDVSNMILVGNKETSVANELYYLYVSAGGNKVKLTIKTTGKTPSMTLTSKGAIDLSFPETSAQIIATMKDCNMNIPDAFSLVITDKSGKDVTTSFNTVESPDVYEIFAGEDVQTGTYTAKVSAVYNEGDEDEITLSKTKTFTVKRTAVKVKLSASKVSLNKKLGDVASVGVTCTTKGYAFVEPFLSYDETKLNVQYVDGKLLVGMEEGAEFDNTYKVSVSAHEGAPAVTLSVAVLKESAKVTSTIKAAGTLDVIRDNTKITITPKYTNALNVDVPAQAELVFYSNANKDNYKTPIAAEDVPFTVVVDENGIFTLTANEKLSSAVSYKAELVTTFGDETVKSSKISLSVKMNAAKLKLYAGSTNKLYAKDNKSRVDFSVASTDASVNGIKTVELVESKLSKTYRGIFELIEYGNGEYAIGFAEGADISKVAGKTITLTFNAVVDGNVTAKANATLTLKVTVVK